MGFSRISHQSPQCVVRGLQSNFEPQNTRTTQMDIDATPLAPGHRRHSGVRRVWAVRRSMLRGRRTHL